MAEHTYRSSVFTAVITWDISQVTVADEGVILADIEVVAYRPSVMDINEYYQFKHGFIQYGFTIPKDVRHVLATRVLLGASASICLPLKYSPDQAHSASYRI